ncbi:hypothetical protein ACQJBY_032078 [Aegilops geniculata]
MSLRRHVNLLLENQKKCGYSLHLLKRDHLFYPTEEAAKARVLPRLRKVPPYPPFRTKVNGQKKKNQASVSDQLESIKLSPAVFTVRPSPCPMACNSDVRLNCFPLSGSKIFFSDSGARTTFYDTEARCMITTPNLHSPKYNPIAVSVPSPGSEGGQDGGDHSLYIMDTLFDPCKASPFEALICCKRPDRDVTAPKTWHCDTLPLPPFLDTTRRRRISILSYSVVGDVICVSPDGLGTYCFDTVSRTWSLAGDWQMPFYGKAEYIPELKLWFGLSAANPELPCAADLSNVLRGHEPKQRYVWRDPDLPEEWYPLSYGSSNIISFGSGRFCITNFYEDMNNSFMDGQSGPVGESIVVFTGLEVLSGKESGSDSGKGSGSDMDNGNGNGNGNGLRMIKHKSCTIAETDFIQSIL